MAKIFKPVSAKLILQLLSVAPAFLQTKALDGAGLALLILMTELPVLVFRNALLALPALNVGLLLLQLPLLVAASVTEVAPLYSVLQA